MTGRVHLIEVGGRGGVFHHTVGVAEALAAAGTAVVLHTADDAELTPAGGVELCSCMRWRRHLPHRRRQLAVVGEFAGHYTPHVAAALAPGDIAHLQGAFVPPLLAGLVTAVQIRRRPLVFSPHNTFARYGGRLNTAALRWCARRADATIAFSLADQHAMARWGVAATCVDLAHLIPRPAPAQVDAWRQRLGDRPVALLAGQIRPDKRPELLVEAVARMGGAVRAAVVGEDRGGAAAVRAAAARTGSDVVLLERYLELSDFVALLTAADVVVCPYQAASVSGPLAMAHVLGVRSVVTDAGGLSELATATAPPTAEGLASAIAAVLCRPAPAPVPYGAEAASQHLAVYRAAGWTG